MGGDTVSTRVGMRHRSTLQLLDGDKPSDGSQYPAHSGYRLRYRFECGMCGDVKVERGENLFDKFNRLRDARPDNDTDVIPLHILRTLCSSACSQPRGRPVARSIGGLMSAGSGSDVCAVQMGVNGGSELLIFVP